MAIGQLRPSPRSQMLLRGRPTPVPGTAAVRCAPAVSAVVVRSSRFSAASPTTADMAARWPGRQYLTRSGHGGGIATGGLMVPGPALW
jgi:hypothetical protein